MIPLALAHCLLQPGSKQGTNGGAFLGSENTSFPQKFRFDFQCNIGLHICTYSRAALFYVLSSGRSTASTARRPWRILKILNDPCNRLPISVVESTWRSGRVAECDGLENKLGGTTFLIFSITYATFSYLSWASKGQNLKANVQQIVQRFGMCATGPTRLLAPPRKGCFRGASTRP